jgi:hypothetical protein
MPSSARASTSFDSRRDRRTLCALHKVRVVECSTSTTAQLPERLRSSFWTVRLTDLARRPPPGPDAAFHVLQRIAIYIVISIPNRKSIARGVSHFITISYVYFTVEPKTEAGVQLACVRVHAADR